MLNHSPKVGKVFEYPRAKVRCRSVVLNHSPKVGGKRI
jgi:hypothetical protein